MSIKLRIVLGFGVLVALILVLGLVTASTTAYIDHTWRNVVESAVVINNKAAEFEFCRLMTRRYEKDFLLYYKTDGLQYTKDHYIKGALYSQLKRMKVLREEIDLLMLKKPQRVYFSAEKIPKLIDAYRAVVDAGVGSIESLEARSPGGASQIYTIIITDPKVEGIRSVAGALEAESRKMAELARNNVDDTIMYANKIAQNSLFLVFWLTLCILLMAISFAVFMIWVIVRSLKKLSLSAKAAIQGELSNSFKSVLAKIRQVIPQITLVSNAMHTVSSREISLASEQSRAIRAAHDSADRILENITQISEQLKKSTDEAGNVGNRIQELRGQVHITGSTVTSLNEFMHKITKVSESIAAASEQINIIAMNASLEASRAAESQGSEFNPMMNSIRKLSDAAVKSTKDITKLIESVNIEISKVADILLETEQHLDSEINHAQGSFAESKDITMKCTQEGTGAKVVADAMATLEHVIDVIISAAKEIEGYAAQLTKVSADLQINVDKFKAI